MKLLFHLVRADVRRFRLLLAPWVLVEVLNTVFTAVQPTLAHDVRTTTAVGLLAAVLFLTRWLGLIFIVPLVVQTHPLVGSDAFWMTRPIPPRLLLASKLLLLGTTFVVVPALCEVALMAASRVPIAEIALVALQTLLLQSLWLGILMSLSAVTRNLGRFVLVAGGVLVSLAVLMSVGIAVAMRNLNDGPQLGIVESRSVSGPAEGVVALLLLTAAAVLPLVIQYKTRFTRLSVSTGVAGLTVAILFALMWPSRGELLPVPAWASQDAALRLVAESSTGEFRAQDRWPDSNRTEWRIGRARLRLRGVEQDWLPTVRLAGATVELADGATLATAANGYQQIIPFESVDDFPNRIVMRQVLGVGQVAGQESGPFPAMPVPAIVVSQADFDKYSAASGTYRGRFLVDLDRAEIAAALPLRAGAEYHDRRRRIVIDEVIQQGQAATIRVRQFVASTLFHTESLPRLSFYLRNRDAGEAVEGMPSGVIGVSAGLAIPLVHAGAGSAETTSGFSVKGDSLRFPHYDSREDTIPITADWLSHAELVIVRIVQWGSVTRTVEIPGFEIRAAPPPPTMLRAR